MIIEQAFLQLPEILHGSGYRQQDYEAGIVGALSLSVLQVLNGHNTNNPIACLHHEKLFRDKGIFKGFDKPRYLRADLHVSVGRLLVANNRLAQYGWRHNLWLEAKFLRNQTNNGTKPSSNKSTHAANFLADIIRLAILVPENTDTTSDGRYFLHVYDSDPKLYLTFSKRKWMKALCLPGQQRLIIKGLDQEPDTVKKLLGEFPGLGIELGITNMVVKPLITDNHPCYWMYLSRIDAIKVMLNNDSVEMQANRRIIMSKTSALDEIASFVVSRIHINPKSVESLPPVETEDIEETV